MEDLFENYEVKVAKKDVNSVISNISTNNTKNITSVEPPIYYDTTTHQSNFTNILWTGSILIAFPMWIVCIVSLILNIVRKNVGKAIISGVGLIVPIITIFLVTICRTFVSVSDTSSMLIASKITMIIALVAFVIEVVFLILSFIFCFSKNKNVANNKNNVQ